MCLLVLASCFFLVSADKKLAWGPLTDLVTPFQVGPDLCRDLLVRKKEGDMHDVPFTNFASFVCCSSYSYSACVLDKMYGLRALGDKYLPSKAPLPLKQLHFRAAYHARNYALLPVCICAIKPPRKRSGMTRTDSRCRFFSLDIPSRGVISPTSVCRHTVGPSKYPESIETI